MNRIQQLAELGQSIWLDYIRRSFITSGGMQALIDQGVRGMTSNPTIFDKAIAGSTDYDEDLKRLAAEGKSPQGIFYALAIADIQAAADLLRPVYEQTGGDDGYVSLEVGPDLADDTEATIAEACRLFAAVDRPNVMIKVPATPAGLPAIQTLIGEGININITLMFSLDHYEAVTEAYLAGLEHLASTGRDLSSVASVASFFVSRVDSIVDKELEKRGEESMLGKTAIANAKLTYARFKEIFRGERWDRLAAQGARVQRPLWASTSTKNPRYPDTIYVDNLIGPHTVNTLPQSTYDAFLDHGTVALTIEQGLDEARAHLARLAEVGIDLDQVTEQLQVDGVAAFAKSFESLLATIAEKRERVLASLPGPYEIGGRPTRWGDLRACRPAVEAALVTMAEQRVLARLWAKDHTLWKPDPAGIADRLGWLDAPEAMCNEVPRLEAFARSVRDAGYTHGLLLGMGGSSLAPEVMSKIFAGQEGSSPFTLSVLDSTVPGAVLAHAERLDPARTLFIVSTKSGTTVETLSLFKFFYNWTAQAVGPDRVGEHFVAITDPGSNLADLAARHGFRETFLNDPHIGGRYSALSLVGLVPAALVAPPGGITTLLDRAQTVAAGCTPFVPPEDNLAAWLGAALAETAAAGLDKLTFVTSPGLASFGDWAEQLIAESTGKEGKGILPVVGEPLRPPPVYGHDRVFVYLKLAGDSDGRHDVALEGLRQAGHPLVRLDWNDRYDLGGQFLLWELATAIAGHRLEINPFDQPNVEAAKALARQMVAAYIDQGTLPEADSAPLEAGALHAFLDGAQPGDYIAIQAYLPPSAETDQGLNVLRAVLRDRTRLATTLGYGPRYLHSTGQFHKGGPGSGLFIQFTADDPQDVPIPDEAGEARSSISFGILKMAQALGDRQALLDAGRRVIRFHLGTDVAGALKNLTEALL